MPEDSNPIILTSKSSTKDIVLYVIIAILVTLVAILLVKDLSYSMGKISYNPLNKAAALPSDPTQTGYVKTSPLFSAQNATIQGRATSVTSNSVTVLSKSNSETFKLAQGFQVYKYKTGSAPPEISKQADSIEEERDAIFSLQVVGNEFQISAISYQPKTN